MQEVALEIEKAGKAGNLAAVSVLIPKLGKQFDQLKKAMLTKELQRHTKLKDVKFEAEKPAAGAEKQTKSK